MACELVPEASDPEQDNGLGVAIYNAIAGQVVHF
jgi:hypothetical protein